MEKYLRSWRQDALNRGQHDSAIYIGDKVLALTNSDSDAFWLAQVHFSNNNFTRALALLSRKDLVSRSTACRYLAAHCYIKQNHFEQALSILGEHNPTDLFRNNNSRRKIQHLNGQSHVTLRNGKHTIRAERGEDREREDTNNVKFEAAMCYLRGLCFAKQNAFDRARDCYKDAVRIDVQCFEAFDQLMKNSLMSPTEELDFLESLDFDAIVSPDPAVAQEAAHFTKMLYTTRLSKYSAPNILSDATETLSTHYNLADNPDILLSRAEALYTQCRFAEALELTSSILSTSQSPDLTATNNPGIPSHNHLGHAPAVYPLHLACLYETGATNALFLLSHMLADHAPEEPYTYLAIGVYYLSVSKVAEARRFFSKASLLDPHSAPAWIGFAHTFAAEGEHDQAIAAYSTAARLFQGSHLPQLFLGMQHLALNNMSLAHEYLCAAYAMSTGATPGITPGLPTNLSAPLGGDPLVLNELGVVFYHQNNLGAAVELFRQALGLAASLHCEPGAWVATRANLGHALRRMGRLPESLHEFDECLRVGAGGTSLGYSPFLGGGAGGSAAVATASGVGGYEDRGLVGSLHTSRGLLLLELGRTTEAVTALHEAVRVLGASGGGDAAGGAGVAGTLLNRALELWALEGRERNRQILEGVGPSTSPGSRQSREDHGRERTGTDESVRRRARGGTHAEEWTDEVTHTASLDTPEALEEERVEMDLDEKADSLLGRALGRVRPGGRQRRTPRPATPDVDQEVLARRGRHHRSQSRQ
ncbi:Tetratricopeptide-like helical [Penicillium macrosclerotiorum]|uniref:Tetratricopeptide-like helical n=1 Tax=Penicillium macrosclerotiorum TaxID=303699 RepID=UPI00254893E4|nr:Tetratricopeptide-like helical [Penicillium macrosclerotiorum]KAJ5669887.1 Tetratricopeptide-like helical [Penicillium macrosclerotiorum]